MCTISVIICSCVQGLLWSTENIWEGSSSLNDLTNVGKRVKLKWYLKGCIKYNKTPYNVWRFVVLSFSNSYLFYSPQQEFFYLSLCLRENTNHNHSEPLTDQCTLSFHCQTSACSPARENESPTYEHFEEMFTFV